MATQPERSAHACPSENVLAAFVAGELPEAQAIGLDEHFDRCARCFALLQALTPEEHSIPTLSGGEPTATAPALGDRLGRFVLLHRIGAGGMGIVFAAYDPELDRKVAVKLIRPRTATHEAARARMRREARVMARLSHPNIVTVHDVGALGEHVYVAMEFVDGVTLREATEGKPWPEVVEAYLQAGRGLAAAHGEGIVHRDFKPDNAMVGHDGRVRVMDFGLAGLGPAHEGAPRPAAPGDDVRLTQAGEVLGTPAYMAPEQVLALPTDARTDQFSFCVSLWEALYGERPFAGGGFAALAEAITSGEHRPPPKGTDVPGWVRAVVERGLRVEPEDRWASMPALLQALAHDPGIARRRRMARIGGGVAAVALLAAGGLGLRAFLARQAERCTGADAQLAGVWDDAKRSDARDAVLGTGLPFAPKAWENTVAALDAHASAWADMHREACEATAIRGEQSTRVLDLRMACLRRARVELQAVADVLVAADADTVQNAHEMVAALSALDRCADVEALAADLEPPTASEATLVESARAALARAGAEREAGHYPAARDHVERAAELLGDATYPPAHIELALERGGVLERLGEYESAVAAFEDAFARARAAKSEPGIHEAATRLLSVLGNRLRRSDEAMTYSMLALALAPDEVSEARVRMNIANARHADGAYAEAEAENRGALDVLERSLGPHHPDVANALNNLGNALQAQAKYAEAEVEHRRALELREAALGPDHPDVALSHNNLAGDLQPQGKLADAEAELRRSVSLRERALGPDHPEVAQSLNNLAGILYQEGKTAEAEAELRRALSIRERALGPEHADVAESHANLSSILYAQHRYAEAEAEAAQAVALWQKALGPDHPSVAYALNNLSVTLVAQNKFAEAEVHHRRALALFEKTLGQDHPEVAVSRHGLASTLLELGKAREALALAELAWARLRRDDVTPDRRGRAGFILAEAIWETAPDAATRARAVATAEQALDAYARAEGAYDEAMAEVREWIAAHPAPR